MTYTLIFSVYYTFMFIYLGYWNHWGWSQAHFNFVQLQSSPVRWSFIPGCQCKVFCKSESERYNFTLSSVFCCCWCNITECDFKIYIYCIAVFYVFIELPITFLTPLSDVQVYEKDEARFECEISREPKTFRWLKGTQELKADDKFDILTEGKRHILIVKSAAYEDEAKYMFEAEDKRTSAKLIIQGHYSLL